MTDLSRVLAVDLGGTNLRVAVVSTDGAVTHRRQVPAEAAAGPRAVAARMATLLTEIAAEAGLPPDCPAGVAVPGPIEPRAGIVRFTPNLAGWRDFPLGDTLRTATGRPVAFGNDGNCAALGEARFGVGAGSQHLVYLALGTGVGGGVITHGRLVEGVGGLGAELGHVVVALDGPRCTCGSVGCLETFASGWALAREAALVASTADGVAIRRAAGARPLTASAIAAAAAEGDPAALAILDRAGRALGAAIGAFANIFNPELVVIGGGLGGALGEALLVPTRRAIPAHCFGAVRDDVRLTTSSLGDDTALFGAAALAFAPQR